MPQTQPATQPPSRLAQRRTPLTTGGMEKFLRQQGIPSPCYRAWVGGQSFKELIAMNPTWKLRRWQELVLENLDILQADEEFCAGLGKAQEATG